MKKQLLFIFLILSGFMSFGQNFQWAKSFGGGGEDYGRFVTVDDSANVYIMGYGGAGDFDPGPGTFNLSGYGYFLTKLDASGKFKWAINIVGDAYSMAIGKSGNIYLFGEFRGKLDFDPDTATFNIISESNSYDMFITKLKPNGKFLWSKRIGGKESEYPSSICLDKMENIHITGNYSGLVDFDPGAATYKLTATYYDVYIAKYDSSGNFIWTKSYGVGWGIGGNAITIDHYGNVIITGDFSHRIIFDSVNTIFSNGATEGFILKLNPKGNFIWAKTISGPLEEGAFSVTTDNFGNIYTTGCFEDSVDFDMGIGKYYLAANRGKDIFVSKIDSNGNFIWAKSFGGVLDDLGRYIVLDDSNNVYFTGVFNDSADFDPDSDKLYLFGENSKTIFTAKLTSSGKLVWAKKTGGFTDLHYNCIAVDKKKNIYTVGSFQNTTDFNPDDANSSLTSIGYTDAFISKLGPCPSPAETIKGQSSFCDSNVTTDYSISQASGANGYKWTVPSDATLNSGQNTTSINVTFGKISGNITVIPSNACDTNSFTSLHIKINQSPKVGIKVTPSATVCKGTSVNLSGTGASTYEWSGGIINGQSFSANSSETYTLKGTDLNSCTDTAIFNLRVNIKPGIILNPIEQYVDAGSNAEFVVSASFTKVFQWQQWVGSNYINLSNTSQFFGVNKDTLTIKNVTPSQNQYKFRCNIGEPGCTTLSNSAYLYVNKGGFQTFLKNHIFSIYPNPATNLINIESSHTLTNSPYIITDQTGRQILKGELNNKINTVDISALASGFYFLQIGEATKETFKIIKQ